MKTDHTEVIALLRQRLALYQQLAAASQAAITSPEVRAICQDLSANATAIEGLGYPHPNCHGAYTVAFLESRKILGTHSAK